MENRCYVPHLDRSMRRTLRKHNVCAYAECRMTVAVAIALLHDRPHPRVWGQSSSMFGLDKFCSTVQASFIITKNRKLRNKRDTGQEIMENNKSGSCDAEVVTKHTFFRINHPAWIKNAFFFWGGGRAVMPSIIFALFFFLSPSLDVAQIHGH